MPIPDTNPPGTTRSWEAMVREADPDYQKERLHPIVYFFGGNRTFRDKGEDSAIYSGS
jgi:hypothetical protein|tara:strand:+ start:16 stop:189 length:174 start_codon:yes stop_codon:yes gene_type:complete